MQKGLSLALLAALFGCSNGLSSVAPSASSRSTQSVAAAVPDAIAGPVVQPVGAAPYPIGVTPGSGFEFAFKAMTPEQQRAILALMKTDGVGWLRLDYFPASLNFGPMIQSAQAAGIKVDVVLEDWQATPVQFATFAQDAARTLGADTYEILNEVNLHDGGTISAAQYVPVLKAAYGAIKSVNPRAFVLASGLGAGSQDPVAYLAAMYAAGARGYFDAANFHPYTGANAPMPRHCQTSNAFCHDAPAMRGVMVSNGDAGKAIWFTEYGCPTGTTPGVGKQCSDDVAGDNLAQAYAQARRWPWVGGFFVFDWQDDTTDGDFGLYLSKGDPKPHVLDAFRNFQKLS